VNEGTGTSSLRDRDWDVGYSHEDGDLVAMFFVPALSRARLYLRATGYFSGDVLALAARGLDALIARGGRMQLLVGCTLSEQDVEDIKKGYDVREAVTRSSINRIPLTHESPQARRNIGYLAWMIAHGFLDVKIAVPLDEHGEMRAGLGFISRQGRRHRGRCRRQAGVQGIDQRDAGGVAEQLRIVRRELLVAR